MRMLHQLSSSVACSSTTRPGFTNRMTNALKQYFPQALDWFEDSATRVLFCDFLTRWPTLKHVKRARKPG